MAIFSQDTVTNRTPTQHLRAYIGAVALLLVLILIAPPSTRADDPPRPDDREAIRRMNEQIQELQAKVKELEARLDAATGNAPRAAVENNVTASTRSEATPPLLSPPTSAARSEVTPPPSAAPSAAQETQENFPAPRVNLRMFGDLGYEASTQKRIANSFYIGTLDLFLTGALTERVSVLGEVLFTPQMDNSIGVDVERLLLQYKHNDYLNFAVGRYHSSIGYYNTAFHQGAWFQTTVDRPFMYAFDDAGGFLPLQEVGVTMNGQIPSGSLGLNYVAEVGNGRSHLLGSDPAQNFRDTQNGKSVNFALYSRPSRLPGLQTGFSIYHDYLTFSDNINHDELISTAYVIFSNSNYEVLNEAMLVRHTNSKLGAPGVFHTPGFYTQISRRFGKYRPYFRYAYINAGVEEPIYGDPTDGPVVGRRNGPSFGLRYELNDHAAFKLQYDRLSERGVPTFSQLLTQFSFAF
jgi:hypothetical protein